MKQPMTIHATVLIVTAGLVLAWLTQAASPPGSVITNAHAEEQIGGSEEPENTRGPRGGRLLSRGSFALEITIFEKGIPPEFHVYAYREGEAISPEQVNLQIELARLGGRTDRLGFLPQEEYLRGDGIVEEPHSFDVSVTASYKGKTHRWSYQNHEGRTRIADAMAEETGIETEIAGAATIHETASLTGRIQTDPNRLSRVRPRFPGLVKTVLRNLGDEVEAGDVLATVQSNESLQTYSVRSPIGGTIVRRDIQVGESTGDKLLFIVTDLSVVWVELDVFSRDLARVRPGQEAAIETFDGHRVNGVIDWISPLAAHASQSVRARVPLSNPDGLLRPGQFVRGTVTVEKIPVPLAIRKSALQRFRDFQVVFARFGESYEVRMLELGRSDSDWIEVLGGLEPGIEYVTANSYLIKADIEKSGASHAH
jgi:cobalt-zinc-cadmium efflux system membrane fusion protein